MMNLISALEKRINALEEYKKFLKIKIQELEEIIKDLEMSIE